MVTRRGRGLFFLLSECVYPEHFRCSGHLGVPLGAEAYIACSKVAGGGKMALGLPAVVEVFRFCATYQGLPHNTVALPMLANALQFLC